MFFQWAQLIHTIPTRWKTLISNYSDIDEENLFKSHNVIKKLSSKDNIFDSNFKHC